MLNQRPLFRHVGGVHYSNVSMIPHNNVCWPIMGLQTLQTILTIGSAWKLPQRLVSICDS